VPALPAHHSNLSLMRRSSALTNVGTAGSVEAGGGPPPPSTTRFVVIARRSCATVCVASRVASQSVKPIQNDALLFFHFFFLSPTSVFFLCSFATIPLARARRLTRRPRTLTPPTRDVRYTTMAHEEKPKEEVQHINLKVKDTVRGNASPQISFRCAFSSLFFSSP
jgi:hypothetical protein